MDLTCPACRSPGRAHSLVVENRYRLIRCTACGSQYFRPDSSLGDPADTHADSEYWERYKFDLYGSSVIRDAFAARYNRLLGEARQHVMPLGSILDIGCGVGNFVSHAESVGLRAIGAEVDPAAVAIARQRGLSVYVTDELDHAVADSSVDALSLWDVIEHLFEPSVVLAQVLPKVRPGGAVLIETPDAGFPIRPAILGAHRMTNGRLDVTGPMYYWEHKIYFTESGLRILLGRMGVDVVSVYRETSLREKLAVEFSQHNDGSPMRRFLDNAWPILEAAFRHLGRGNKLLMVGRVRDEGAGRMENLDFQATPAPASLQPAPPTSPAPAR
jgi:SAM-dependent methyltransferase